MSTNTKLTHIIVDLWGCIHDNMIDLDNITNTITFGLNKLGIKAHGVQSVYSVDKKVHSSLSMAINNGHVSMAIYPDAGFVAVDILNLKEKENMIVIRNIIDTLSPLGVSVKSLKRGRGYGIQDEYSYIKAREDDEDSEGEMEE